MLTPYSRPAPPRAAGAWPWHLASVLLILASAGLHAAYLAVDCPLDLAPDEAHYWHWSRHLDWSYYSKGPLVAYLIRAGCELAGGVSEAWTGSAMFAVRLPAVVCGALLLLGLHTLTVQVFGSARLGAAVVAAVLTLPVVSAGATLMTIDSPYTCCWGWALVLVHRAVFGRSAWAWPAAGVVIGLGILAKYTMVLFVPSVALFLLTSREHRRLLLRPGFWGMAAVAGLGCLPVLWWNVRNDWVTFHHVGSLAGVRQAVPAWHWHGPFVYFATQGGLLLGFWFVAWAAAMVAHRPGAEGDAGVRYLWWTSATTFGVFLAFSVKTAGGEPNWPVTAYLSGLVLTAAWLARRLKTGPLGYRRTTAAGLAAACLLGVALTAALHRSDLIYPILERLAGAPTDRQPFPLRRLDPTCRLRGWRTLAAEVDRVRGELRGAGVEPVLAGSGWTYPGEVAFYCAGHPIVYSVGPALGDRHSQYDLWRPNPIADAQAFLGRTFVVVGVWSPALRQAFDEVEAPREVVHREGGRPVAGWSVTVCRGFRGFPGHAATRY